MLSSEQLQECAQLLIDHSKEILVSLENSETAQELSKCYEQSAKLLKVLALSKDG